VKTSFRERDEAKVRSRKPLREFVFGSKWKQVSGVVA
jgi:hypothetical protein